MKLILMFITVPSLIQMQCIVCCGCYLNYFSRLQNDLQEFYSLVNLCNPGVLGE